MTNRLLLIALVIFSFALSACGKQGPLRPPEGAEENEQLDEDLLDPNGGEE